MSSAADVKATALAEFATAGYTGTSIARIAELAGLSKSSVLYHFESKEALLEASVAPALERMSGILDTMASRPFTRDNRRAFIAEFVDFLLDHRLAVHLFINQSHSLVDLPVMDRANELVLRMAEFFSTSAGSTEERMRFGIALGGAAYLLVTERAMALPEPPRDETKAALIAILSTLLDPIAA